MDRIVIVSGGFDPLHSGHINYFKEARKLGDKLYVALNSDAWLTRKKGKPFMSLEERASIIQELKCVDKVFSFDDSDDTACNAIYSVLLTAKEVIFANGGDRAFENTPELNKFKGNSKVKFAWGVGGDYKKNSSSWILDAWKTDKTDRPWGYWRVLNNKPNMKVKELVIKPGASLSDQKHSHRSEHWYILSGVLQMKTEYNGVVSLSNLHATNSYVVGQGVWHKASNIGKDDCHVLEVQYGAFCEENDIERRD